MLDAALTARADMRIALPGRINDIVRAVMSQANRSI